MKKFLSLVALLIGWNLATPLFEDGHWVVGSLIRIVLVLYFIGQWSDEGTPANKSKKPHATPAASNRGKTVARVPSLSYPSVHDSVIPSADIKGRPNVHGIPGAGLSKEVFGAKRATMGEEGERRLANILACYKVDRYAQVFYSLRIPNFDGIDVDCAVLTGLDLYLIDAKLWKTGDRKSAFTRTTPTGEYSGKMLLRDYDEDSSHPIGPVLAEYPLKKTMVMAAEQYSRIITGVAVHTVTVLCPTSSGVSGIMDDAKTADGNMLRQAEEYVANVILPAAEAHPLTRMTPNVLRLERLLKADVE